MKILVFSDVHADASTIGFDRFDDVAWAMDRVVEMAKVGRANAVLFLGDLCDPDTRRSHRCAALAVRIAMVLKDRYVHSGWLVGNHDVIEDGVGSSTMSSLAELEIRDGVIRVYNRPRVDSICGLPILALPYASRSHHYDPAEFVRRADVPDEGPVLVIGHLTIDGIGPGSESGDMARGRSMIYPIDAIRERFGERATMLCGHYHAGQTFRGIHIPGSLVRLRFDEEHNEPRVLWLDVGDDGIDVTPFPMPSRTLTTARGDRWNPSDVKHALVRFVPPVGMSDERATSVVNDLYAAGAERVVSMPIGDAIPIVATTERPMRRTAREAVMSVASRAMSDRPDELRMMLEIELDREGL